MKFKPQQLQKTNKGLVWHYLKCFCFYSFIFLSLSFSKFPKFIRVNFGPVPLEQLIFNLSIDVGLNTPMELISKALEQFIYKPLFITFLCFLVLKFIKHPKQKYLRKFFILLAFFLLCRGAYKSYNDLSIASFFEKDSTHHDWFLEYYHPPNILKSSRNTNLVLLYLESMESRYINKDSKLAKYASQGVTANQFPALPGTQWTFAAMLSSQCSVPLMPIGLMQHSSGTDNPLNNGICLGDILKSNNYHTVYLTGVSEHFAGTGQFYTQHGFREVIGLDQVTREHNEFTYPQDWWGIYDSDLYSIAQTKLLEISKNPPFAFVFSTIDTHTPTGIYSPWCAKNHFSNDLKGVYDCSIAQTGLFIEWFEQQSFAKNTILVVMGDHPFMGDGPPTTTQNRDVFFMLKSPSQKSKRIDITHFDIAPIILEEMGFELESGRMGLGQNVNDGTGFLLKQNNIKTISKIMRHPSKSYLKLWIK